MTGIIEIPNESVELHIYNGLVDSQTISIDVSEEARLSCIDINQHLRLQMRAQNLKMNRLWFYKYMEDEAFARCDNINEVYITVYLNFCRKYEAIEEKFLDLNITKYCANKYGGTHLVKSVTYGAEFVLWMRKPIDPSKGTKQTAEQTLRLELKSYLDYFFKPDLDPPDLDEELNSMSCSFQSSIHNSFTSNGTFAQCLQMIKELIDMEKNDRENIWRTTRMRLCPIPTLVEIQKTNELHADTVFKLELKQQWVKGKFQQLVESHSFRQVPFLRTPVIEFQKLMKPIASLINKKVKKFKKMQNKYYSPDYYSSITEPYVNLLQEALEWLTIYREFMEKVEFVLKGNSLIPVLDLRSIREEQSEVGDGEFKKVKVFVLHFACVTAALDERFKKWLEHSGISEYPSVFTTEYSEVDSFVYVPSAIIHKKFQTFSNEAIHSVGDDVSYAVGILSLKSPYYEEGTVFTMSYKESTLPHFLPQPPAAIDVPRITFAEKALSVVTQPAQSPIAVSQPGLSTTVPDVRQHFIHCQMDVF